MLCSTLPLLVGVSASFLLTCTMNPQPLRVFFKIICVCNRVCLSCCVLCSVCCVLCAMCCVLCAGTNRPFSPTWTNTYAIAGTRTERTRLQCFTHFRWVHEPEKDSPTDYRTAHYTSYSRIKSPNLSKARKSGRFMSEGNRFITNNEL